MLLKFGLTNEKFRKIYSDNGIKFGLPVDMPASNSKQCITICPDL
jgi:hypothetical protein